MRLASNGLPPWLFPVNAQKSSMFYRKWDRSQAPAPASGAHYRQEGWSTGASSPGLTSVPRWPSPGPGMGLMPTGWCPGSSREPSPTWRGAPKHGGGEGRYHLRPLGADVALPAASRCPCTVAALLPPAQAGVRARAHSRPLAQAGTAQTHRWKAARDVPLHLLTAPPTGRQGTQGEGTGCQGRPASQEIPESRERKNV